MPLSPAALEARPRVLLRVLIADAVGPVNEGLADLLSDVDSISTFGCAPEPAKLLSLVNSARPDVVILDLQVPGPVGLRTLRHLKQFEPPPFVIVLSHHELPPLREACLAAGADVFLHKTSALDQLAEVLAGFVRERELHGPRQAGNLKTYR